MNNQSLDLKTRAHQAMLEAGFHPDFPPEVLREVSAPKSPPTTGKPADVQDMRNLLWSSIDNDTSRDLDQIEFAEKLPDGTIRLLIGIADVDAMVPAGSATDKHAGSETTSVYTGVATYPMLPDGLSYDKTSLVADQERQSMVVELRIQDSGEVTCHAVFRALVRNRAKLAYNSTGAWLEGTGPVPAPIAAVPGMEPQLRLQAETAKKLLNVRKQNGTLTFSSVEAAPVRGADGEVKDLALWRRTIAMDIIESFMVAANVAMAQHLKENHSLSIRRVVRVPKRWDRIQVIAAQYGTKLPSKPDPRDLSAFLEQRKAADPLHFPDLSLSIVKLLGSGEYIVERPGTEQVGHFGLAVQDYTHSTAPNRRYSDLVTQRLLKATVDGKPCPYDEAALAAIAARCTEREDAAQKLERLMRKIIAANILSHQIGTIFDGVITGASLKGTFVRLLKFPAEGMVVRGAKGLDVGDKVTVKLVRTNVVDGYVDFERQ